MVSRVAPPDPTKPLVNNSGVASEQFRLWTRNVTSKLTVIGSGSPEGVVVAEQSTPYMDEDGASGSVFYIKQKDNIGGDRSLGWVLIG